jgi:glycosyltransferase involved in cell wall biosynthesis
MDGAPWGGSEELWSQTAVRLHDAGHHIVVSTTWWPSASSKLLPLKAQGIEISLVKRPSDRSLIARGVYKLTSRRQRALWLKRSKAELVVISQGKVLDGAAEWMEVCHRNGWPFVTIVHCNSELWWPDDEESMALAAAYSSALRVFGVSRHNLDQLENQVGELTNLELVWNPFNVRSDVVTPWPDSYDSWRIACVATLGPGHKGQDLLLQVLSHPQWRQRPVEVSFYGMGACRGSLQRLAQKLQLSNVHFRGHVADVNAIWEKNHLLVLPSRFEGLPLALVEAMWCARPVVVTDVGGNAEICIDGETGFVADAAAVRSIEEALERAWDRRADWSEMGKRGRARVESLVPKDPIGTFCKQLLDCVATPGRS